ncbi:hypothetical protein C1Y40_04541 [Mycobacterium talmoniae]|uniref:Uncharacterized protein n=1 Tax=Mycobacterium talmoniae TaxID=1858794 RepID=A0A2S8BF95_9MYCO|nr:hypothetical protein [Mycobacterium eburneum]PQM45316.1 hypothetical protein C1Y40_04541 [Mycobacterium talmoniae]TDH47215.1 hypothetical protein E2F47_26665 [Mycobacterium eburneum]
MTDTLTPTLTRDEILQSFLKEAEADTQQVMRVGELHAKFEELQTELVRSYQELVDAYGEAIQRPSVKAKLTELGLRDPATFTFRLPSASKTKTARRGRPRRQAPRNGDSKNGNGTGAPVVDGASSSSTAAVAATE